MQFNKMKFLTSKMELVQENVAGSANRIIIAVKNVVEIYSS